jgi:hypothetical protein
MTTRLSDEREAMEELQTQARLVGFSPSRFAAGGIGTTVTRAEVAEAAARGDFPARLVLDLDRIETANAGEVTAHGRVTVDWDEADLQQLLQMSGDEEIALWFDPLQLARAFEEPEVEAHGLRERAAILAVAVATTGATVGGGLASVANAAPPIPAAGQAVIPDLPAGQQLQPQAAVQTGDPTRIPAPGQAVIPDLPAGQQLQPQAAVQTGDPTRIPAPGQAVIPDLPAGQQLQPPVGTTASVSSGGEAAFPSTGETAAIAAGVALLISAAGFGATRSRTRPPRPA